MTGMAPGSRSEVAMTATAAIAVVRAQARDDHSACGDDRMPFNAAVGIAEDGGSTGADEFLLAVSVLGNDSARRAYDDEWQKIRGAS